MRRCHDRTVPFLCAVAQAVIVDFPRFLQPAAGCHLLRLRVLGGGVSKRSSKSKRQRSRKGRADAARSVKRAAPTGLATMETQGASIDPVSSSEQCDAGVESSGVVSVRERSCLDGEARVAPQARVPRAIHLAHPAGAQLRHDLIRSQAPSNHRRGPCWATARPRRSSRHRRRTRAQAGPPAPRGADTS